MNKMPGELLLKILKRVLTNGGDYADIFIEHTGLLSIQLEDDKIEKITSGVDAGVGIRVISGEKTAYAYSNDFSENSLLNIADSVRRAVREGKERVININLMKVSP